MGTKKILQRNTNAGYATNNMKNISVHIPVTIANAGDISQRIDGQSSLTRRPRLQLLLLLLQPRRKKRERKLQLPDRKSIEEDVQDQGEIR